MSDESVVNPVKMTATRGSYIALIFAILFFSGLFYNVEGLKWLGAFDFTTLGGSFGTIKIPPATPLSAQADSVLKRASCLPCR